MIALTLAAAASGFCSLDAVAGKPCQESPFGVVIAAPSEADSQRALAAIERAATNYRLHFARTPAPIAIVYEEIDERLTTALKSKGLQSLPWLSEAQRNALKKKAIVDALRSAMPGKTEAELSAVAEQQMTGKSSTAKSAELDFGILGHESAHKMLMADWPKSAVPTSYGSPGPDWLDEMAAVLGEDELLTRSRWKHLEKMVSQSSAIERPYPMREYLTMEHPIASQRELLKELRGESNQGEESKAKVIVPTGAVAAKLEANNPARFYAQSRGFAAYLMERSGSPAIFGDILTFMLTDPDFEHWLRAAGARHNLPTSLVGLQADWDKWLAERFS